MSSKKCSSASLLAQSAAGATIQHGLSTSTPSRSSTIGGAQQHHIPEDADSPNIVFYSTSSMEGQHPHQQSSATTTLLDPWSEDSCRDYIIEIGVKKLQSVLTYQKYPKKNMPPTNNAYHHKEEVEVVRGGGENPKKNNIEKESNNSTLSKAPTTTLPPIYDLCEELLNALTMLRSFTMMALWVEAFGVLPSSTTTPNMNMPSGPPATLISSAKLIQETLEKYWQQISAKQNDKKQNDEEEGKGKRGGEKKEEPRNVVVDKNNKHSTSSSRNNITTCTSPSTAAVSSGGGVPSKLLPVIITSYFYHLLNDDSPPPPKIFPPTNKVNHVPSTLEKEEGKEEKEEAKNIFGEEVLAGGVMKDHHKEREEKEGSPMPARQSVITVRECLVTSSDPAGTLEEIQVVVSGEEEKKDVSKVTEESKKEEQEEATGVAVEKKNSAQQPARGQKKKKGEKVKEEKEEEEGGGKNSSTSQKTPKEQQIETGEEKESKSNFPIIEKNLLEETDSSKKNSKKDQEEEEARRPIESGASETSLSEESEEEQEFYKLRKVSVMPKERPVTRGMAAAAQREESASRKTSVAEEEGVETKQTAKSAAVRKKTKKNAGKEEGLASPREGNNKREKAPPSAQKSGVVGKGLVSSSAKKLEITKQHDQQQKIEKEFDNEKDEQPLLSTLFSRLEYLATEMGLQTFIAIPNDQKNQKQKQQAENNQDGSIIILQTGDNTMMECAPRLLLQEAMGLMDELLHRLYHLRVQCMKGSFSVAILPPTSLALLPLLIQVEKEMGGEEQEGEKLLLYSRIQNHVDSFCRNSIIPLWHSDNNAASATPTNSRSRSRSSIPSAGGHLLHSLPSPTKEPVPTTTTLIDVKKEEEENKGEEEPKTKRSKKEEGNDDDDDDVTALKTTTTTTTIAKKTAVIDASLLSMPFPPLIKKKLEAMDTLIVLGYFISLSMVESYAKVLGKNNNNTKLSPSSQNEEETKKETAKTTISPGPIVSARSIAASSAEKKKDAGHHYFLLYQQVFHFYKSDILQEYIEKMLLHFQQLDARRVLLDFLSIKELGYSLCLMHHVERRLLQQKKLTCGGGKSISAEQKTEEDEEDESKKTGKEKGETAKKKMNKTVDTNNNDKKSNRHEVLVEGAKKSDNILSMGLFSFSFSSQRSNNTMTVGNLSPATVVGGSPSPQTIHKSSNPFVVGATDSNAMVNQPEKLMVTRGRALAAAAKEEENSDNKKDKKDKKNKTITHTPVPSLSAFASKSILENQQHPWLFLFYALDEIPMRKQPLMVDVKNVYYSILKICLDQGTRMSGGSTSPIINNASSASHLSLPQEKLVVEQHTHQPSSSSSPLLNSTVKGGSGMTTRGRSTSGGTTAQQLMFLAETPLSKSTKNSSSIVVPSSSGRKRPTETRDEPIINVEDEIEDQQQQSGKKKQQQKGAIDRSCLPPSRKRLKLEATVTECVPPPASATTSTIAPSGGSTGTGAESKNLGVLIPILPPRFSSDEKKGEKDHQHHANDKKMHPSSSAVTPIVSSAASSLISVPFRTNLPFSYADSSSPPPSSFSTSLEQSLLAPTAANTSSLAKEEGEILDSTNLSFFQKSGRVAGGGDVVGGFAQQCHRLYQESVQREGGKWIGPLRVECQHPQGELTASTVKGVDEEGATTSLEE